MEGNQGVYDILHNLYSEQNLKLNLDYISQEEAEIIINDILDDSKDNEIEPDTIDGKGFFENEIYSNE